VDELPNIFSDEEMEMYLVQVFTESITKDQLSVEYHAKVGATLETGVVKGMEGGLNTFNYTQPEYKTFEALRTNVFIFSAAKQYSQVREMSDFIYEKGEKTTFKEFKTKAETVFKTFNENYLKTEFQTAIGQAQSVREWIQAQKIKEVVPNLKYMTQRDQRVRDEHAALDGITLPVDHPFWNANMPKNAWRCRCFTLSVTGKVTDLSTRDLSVLQDEKKFPPEFRMNPGKDQIIFSKRHPYFRVAKGDKALRDNNYNLPIP
jgi:SPP1 gp7 family putative phage head morphogenesis protein